MLNSGSQMAGSWAEPKEPIVLGWDTGESGRFCLFLRPKCLEATVLALLKPWQLKG